MVRERLVPSSPGPTFRLSSRPSQLRPRPSSVSGQQRGVARWSPCRSRWSLHPTRSHTSTSHLRSCTRLPPVSRLAVVLQSFLNLQPGQGVGWGWGRPVAPVSPGAKATALASAPRPGGSSPLHLPLSASTVPAPPALCSSLRILPAWGWPGRPWPFVSAALSLLSAGNALPRLAPRQHPPVQVRTTRPCFRTCRMERPRGGGRRARPPGPGSEPMRLPWS